MNSRGYYFGLRWPRKGCKKAQWQKLWGGLVEAITLQDWYSFSAVLAMATKTFCHVSSDKYQVHKSFLFQFGELKPRTWRRLSMEMALLEKLTLNRLLHLDTSFSIIAPVSDPTSATYHCASFVAKEPDQTSAEGENPLSQIPFLLSGSRMSISLGMACCQAITAISKFPKSESFPNITGNDLIIAISGVLTSIEKAHTTKWCDRNMSTAFWKRLDSEFDFKGATNYIDNILAYEGQSVEEVLDSILTDNPTLFRIVFGRLCRCRRNRQPEEAGSTAIVILTEQMNVWDIIPYRNCDELCILYSPLTVRSRMILEVLVNLYFDDMKDKIRYVFSPSLTPVLLEYQLRELAKETEGTIYLCLGGSVASYLMGYKVAQQFSNVQIV